VSEEGTEHRDLGGSSDEAGEAGGGSGARSDTDPDVKDAGPPPADGPADPEGTSGAEEGISPWAPEAYDADAEGPTQSTED
jgi:hypothetical protein